MKAKSFLISRGVTRLCHFTKFVHLTHILSSPDGILASQNINSDILEQTDPVRLDGRIDSVCCSVQYPNTWYLKKVRERDQDRIFSDWVVIFIDLDILEKRTIAFSPCNAAKGCGQYIFDDINMLNQLYADVTTAGRRRDSQLLSCCPTDDQAEILISGSIPRSFFTGFAVNDKERADHLYALLSVNSMENVPIVIAPDLFSTNWSPLVHRGKLPSETLYEVRKEQ